MSDRAPFHGRAATLAAANTSVDVVAIPDTRTLKATHVNLANNNPAPSRIRLWDSFTDSDGNVHDATTNPVLLLDMTLAAGESVSLGSVGGLFKAIGTVIARATQAAADPDDVTVGVFGEFEE